MADNEFRLADNAARIYEDQKVPNVFGPLAVATVRRLPPKDGDRILDLACGTGILARMLREHSGANFAITGADWNSAMLSVAAQVVDDRYGSIEWQVADVMDLPFGDGVFSKIYCQQGFQFFPDEEVALREMRRVLEPGGQLIMTIWRGDSALFEVVATVLAEHFDQAMADKAMLPFRYKGRDGLVDKLVVAGFGALVREEIPIDRVLENTPEAIELEIVGSPVGADLASVETLRMQNIIAQCHAALAPFRQGDKLILRQTTDIYLATANH